MVFYFSLTTLDMNEVSNSASNRYAKVILRTMPRQERGLDADLGTRGLLSETGANMKSWSGIETTTIVPHHKPAGYLLSLMSQA